MTLFCGPESSMKHILKFVPGEGSISHSLFEGSFNKADHSLKLFTPPFCHAEAKIAT